MKGTLLKNTATLRGIGAPHGRDGGSVAVTRRQRTSWSKTHYSTYSSREQYNSAFWFGQPMNLGLRGSSTEQLSNANHCIIGIALLIQQCLLFFAFFCVCLLQAMVSFMRLHFQFSRSQA